MCAAHFSKSKIHIFISLAPIGLQLFISFETCFSNDFKLFNFFFNIKPISFHFTLGACGKVILPLLVIESVQCTRLQCTVNRRIQHAASTYKLILISTFENVQATTMPKTTIWKPINSYRIKTM